MNYENYFKDMFETIPDYRKIVLLLFLIQKDKNFLEEREFLKNDINRLSLEFENKLMEQKDESLDHIKNEEKIY